MFQKAFVNTAPAILGTILGPRWLSSFGTMSLLAQPLEGVQGAGGDPHGNALRGGEGKKGGKYIHNRLSILIYQLYQV